jgi:hypothetical protein
MRFDMVALLAELHRSAVRYLFVVNYTMLCEATFLTWQEWVLLWHEKLTDFLSERHCRRHLA